LVIRALSSLFLSKIAIFGNISGKKYKRTNIVAAKCESDIVAPMIYNDTTDSILFEHWFEHALLKAIPQGSYLILDNATFHRKSKLHTLAGRAGCSVIFLPPYSPDLNPIENYWSWLKRQLKKTLLDCDNFMEAFCECFKVK